MFKYLPELKKFLVSYKVKTDALSELEARVDDLIVTDLMKDCVLHRTPVESTVDNKNFKIMKFEVKKDDYDHITEHLHLVQKSLPANILVGAVSSRTLHDEEDETQYLIMFKIKKG
jgi:hypothetical protein